MFSVGQKVVCVEPVDDLVQDHIYTVTEIGHMTRLGIYIGVDQSSFGPRAAFFMRRFRPIVERNTSIEIFTKMLKTEPADAS
jgi:hypothetical protein